MTTLVTTCLTILANTLGLAGAVPAISGPPATQLEDLLFEAHELVLGPGERKTVLTGFLLGGGMADVAVLDIDGNHQRRLRIFSFGGGGWTPSRHVALRPEVMFVDLVNIAGRDRLITYERGRLSWFDPESASEQVLVEVTSSFSPPPRAEIPHVDVSRDLNDDGRDDLVVPDVDGFWVFIQRSDGGFADRVKIGPPTRMERIYGADGYRYDPWSQSRVHQMDYDLDGRNDLAFWNEDHFEVHTQDEQGLFSPAPRTFTTEVAFDSDELSFLATGDLVGRVLHSLSDLNRDAVADLGILSLEGQSISSKRSTYEVHFGVPTTGGGTSFAPGTDRTFPSDGRIQLGMERHDLDRDGQVELMFTTIALDFLEGSLWKRLKGFMGDDVWLELDFYRLEGGRFRAVPNTTRRLALDGAPSHREPGWVPLDVVLRGGTHQSRNGGDRYPRAFNTTLRLGDVTGDGRSDLLLAHHPRILNVFPGVPGPALFSSRPHEVAIAIPNDEEYIWLMDLNQDGKQDIVMHHPFTLRDGHGARLLPLGTEPHRVTLLIAR